MFLPGLLLGAVSLADLKYLEVVPVTFTVKDLGFDMLNRDPGLRVCRTGSLRML